MTMKIYTKRGDQGKTSLRHGERVAKDDIRIETNGQIDELNALLGIVVALMPADNPERERLHNLQLLLMKIMGMIADSPNVLPSEDKSFSSMIADLEHYIDENTSKDRFCFVVPGGSLLAAQLQFARTKARTCERRMWTLRRDYTLDDVVMRLMNRLSDYLFILALCVQ
ncbi:cob(I)yrinic acid a,c-diamide adenosyltransferase [Segatella salivae]|uniref:cob(I)yrinic acid a,c-diamide adenosyltransferase n=1 Tax=Segatella salivae TaxID=228604 RepID=UPI00352C1B82